MSAVRVEARLAQLEILTPQNRCELKSMTERILLLQNFVFFQLVDESEYSTSVFYYIQFISIFNLFISTLNIKKYSLFPPTNSKG